MSVGVCEDLSDDEAPTSFLGIWVTLSNESPRFGRAPIGAGGEGLDPIESNESSRLRDSYDGRGELDALIVVPPIEPLVVSVGVDRRLSWFCGTTGLRSLLDPNIAPVVSNRGETFSSFEFF
jgi:hypothetical protein